MKTILNTITYLTSIIKFAAKATKERTNDITRYRQMIGIITKHLIVTLPYSLLIILKSIYDFLTSDESGQKIKMLLIEFIMAAFLTAIATIVLSVITLITYIILIMILWMIYIIWKSRIKN